MPKRIPLRIKLIALFIAIALIPLIAVTLVTLERLNSTLREHALEQAQSIAQTASEEIKGFVISQFSVLKSIETVYPVLSARQREDLVAQVLFLSDAFQDLAILNSEGKEVIRKNRIEVVGASDLRNQSETSEFKAARDVGAYLGPLYIIGGKPFFALAVALRGGNGAFIGVAVAEVDARIMQDVVTRISAVGQSGRAYIVNQRGIVVAHPDISAVLAGKDLSSLPPVASALSAKPADSIQSYQNEEDQEVIGVGVPMNFDVETLGTPLHLATSWTIVTERRASVALQAVAQMVRLALIMLAIALLVSTTAAILFAAELTRPIESILKGLQQFGQNNLRYRVHIESNDETQDLADGFNRMAENLGRSVASLKEERETIAVERNKLGLVLSGINDAVISIDLNLLILTFNVAAEKLFGEKATEAIGKPITQVMTLKAKGKVVSPAEYCRPAATKSAIYQTDTASVISAAGKSIAVAILVSPLQASPTTVIGHLITLHDRSQEEAVESVKREFVSIAAHQLRTPLTAIRWATDIFLNEHGKRVTAEQRDLIEKAHSSTERMVMLVNDLLSAARLEEGRPIEDRRPVDIVTLLKSVIKRVENESGRRKHTLTFTVTKELIPLLVLDSKSVDLALQNLVENAIRYTPNGGKIAIAVQKIADHLAITVSDTGVGIPLDQRDRVFSKFFRGKNVIPLETEGSGLGLFIAKGVVEKHGGTLTFVSEEGKGSTFTITLPLKSAPV